MKDLTMNYLDEIRELKRLSEIALKQDKDATVTVRARLLNWIVTCAEVNLDTLIEIKNNRLNEFNSAIKAAAAIIEYHDTDNYK